MRDSQSLLEQLLAFGSHNITVDDVHRLLGTAGSDRIARLVGNLIDRNAAAVLAEVDRACAEGVDVGQLLDQLLGYFRDVMASAVGCSSEVLLHVSTQEQPAVQAAAKGLGLETILAVLQILDHTLSRLKYLTYPRTVLELALVRICLLEDLDALSELISQLREGAPASSAGMGSNSGTAPRAITSPTAAKSQLSSPAAAAISPAAKKKFEAALSGVGANSEEPPTLDNGASHAIAPRSYTATDISSNGNSGLANSSTAPRKPLLPPHQAK